MTTAIQTVGASSNENVDWHSINWQKHHKTVRRLQARIVKATQENKWNKVKALQHLLTNSYSAKTLAVKRVTENRGKLTAGIDHVKWSNPGSKSKAVQSLKKRGYKPLPLRRVYIPKSNGKKRPLSIPTMKDRAMQALYLLALEPVAETTADNHSYGFRSERSTADAIQQCFIVLKGKHAAQWILEGDIKGCFDNISHKWLMANVPIDKSILTKWLKAGFMEKDILHSTESGVPQGGIISPVLANLALDGLQALLAQHFPLRIVKGERCNPKVNMVRYADDFIITGATKTILENEVKPLVKEFLAQRGLELSTEKTKITHIDDGFDFLSQNVRKYNGRLLTKPSKESVKAFLNNIRTTIKANKTMPQAELIKILNPKILGWANYHRHAASTETFSKAKEEIWKALWQWAKRRHKNKGERWIKAKYFKARGNNQWVFGCEIDDKHHQVSKQKPLLKLIYPIELRFVKHIKVVGEANPFDPQWNRYFEERSFRKMSNHVVQGKKLLALWKEQMGYCPICNQRINQQTGWHVHHILEKSKGGDNTQTNLIMVHPNCHKQIHSKKLEVAKPAFIESLKRLEPYDGKPSRTVLRGGSSSNTASLPDHNTVIN